MAYTAQLKMLDWFAAAGVHAWNVVTIHVASGKVKGLDRARDRAEAEKCFGWCWHENKAGAEVYIRPARWMHDGTAAAWPVVFLDDVSAAAAADIANQHRALVVQTSPGRHHVWIATSRPLTETERHAMQTELAARFGADPASTSGEHLGRFAGYKNNKRGGAWVNIVRVSATAPLAVPPSLPPARSASQGGACASQHDSRTVLGGWSSESEREFGYVIGRLRWVVSYNKPAVAAEADRLIAELVARAEARGKRNPQDYARRTVAAALARIQPR